MTNQAHLTGNRFSNTTTSYAALTEQAKAALSTSKPHVLNHLHKGDRLEGTLIKIEDKIFLKEHLTGQLIATSLVDESLLNQLKGWEVKGFEGDKRLLVLREQLFNSGFTQNILDQALETLNLPKEAGMRQILEDFAKLQLPLIKEPLTQAYRLTQTTDLPGTVLAQLFKVHLTRQPEVSELPKGYQAFKHVEGYADGKLQACVETSIKLYAEVLVKQQGRHRIKGENALETLLDILDKVLSKNLLEVGLNKLFREGGKTVEAFTTKGQHLPTEETIFDDKQKLLEEISQQDSHKQHKHTLVKSDVQLLLKQFEAEGLSIEAYLKKCLKTFTCLEAKDIKEASQETVGLKDSVLFKEDEIIARWSKEMRTVASKSSQLEYALDQLDDHLISLYKLKEEGNFYAFPFMQDLEEAQGKVYFYKPPRRNRKGDKSLYTVIALEMPALKSIEIHVHQVQKNLKMAFYIEEEKARALVEKEGIRLIEPLQRLGYRIEQMSFHQKDGKGKGARIEFLETVPSYKGLDYQV